MLSKNDQLTFDPVCQMEKPISQMQFKKVYQNQEVYFCSEACAQSFENLTDRYIEILNNHQNKNS